MSRRAPIPARLAPWALAALLVLPGAAAAEGGEAAELPWWAQGDYAEPGPEPASTAPAADPDAPEDVAWWAGGRGTVVVREGGVPEEDPYGTALRAVETVPPEEPEAPGADGDDGRNPLHHRPDGHRAGEDPAGASTDPGLEPAEREDPNQCNRYAKQIPRYKAQLEIAKDRKQGMAVRALEAQIARLEERQERVCPQPPKVDPVAVAMDTLLKAARIAAKVARIMYGSPF